MLDPLLSDREVAEVTGRARSTLQKDRVAGTGIPFVRLGRLIRYRQADVSSYLASLPSFGSTSEFSPECDRASRRQETSAAIADTAGRRSPTNSSAARQAAATPRR